MNARRLWALWAASAAMACMMAAASCAGPEMQRSWQKPQVVRIEGGDKWFAMFPSHVTWLSVPAPGRPAGLLLRDGEIITGGDMPFPYRAADGQLLKVSVAECRSELAGKTLSVALAAEGPGVMGWKWLEKASPQDLAGLRVLEVRGGLDEARLALLRKVAAANPAVALALIDGEMRRQVLPLFRPRTLVLGNAVLTPEEWKVVADQRQLETLFLSAREPGSLDALPQLPALSRLMISDWDVEKAGPLPRGCTRLQSLMVVGAENMKDLSGLANLSDLEELSLLACKPLNDLSGLARFPNLRVLILNVSEGATDLSPLKGLKQLRWLGLPPKTTQEQFATIVRDHPGLAVLEMVRCEDIKDLGPLRDLKGLEDLVLVGPYKDVAVLREVKSLRFVAYADPSAKDETPARVAEIARLLPDAAVVQAAPMCLGSGWILFLLPAAALVWLIPSRRRGAAPGPQHG
jgi:hypothetical protein